MSVVRQRGRNASPRTRKALGRLHNVASTKGSLRIEAETIAKPIYLAVPLSEPTAELEEGTVVRGRVVGVRIDPKEQGGVTIRFDDGGQSEFSTNLELTVQAATWLGRHVSARVTFFRGEERDWPGEIEALEERAPSGDFLEAIEKARDQLREKSVVVDSKAWLAEEDEP